MPKEGELPQTMLFKLVKKICQLADIDDAKVTALSTLQRAAVTATDPVDLTDTSNEKAPFQSQTDTAEVSEVTANPKRV